MPKFKGADSYADTMLEGATEQSAPPSFDSLHFSNSVRRKSLLGRGGVGQVHIAEQESLGRDIAVKAVHPSVSSSQSKSLLLREARIMAKLDHPAIVPIYDLREIDGEPCVLMKRVIGKPLDEHIEVHKPALSDRLRIFSRICEAVAFAHHNHILHLDIKPNNILLGDFGEVYVADWGMAREFEEESDKQLSGGTPNYMAPEMVDGVNIGVHTDVYLLGGLLYYLLEENPPHQGSSPTALMSSIALSELKFEKSRELALQQICARATNADPAKRYQSVEALREAIEGYKESRIAERMTSEAEELHASLKELDEAESRQASYIQARTLYEQALSLMPDMQSAGLGLSLLLGEEIKDQIANGNYQNAVAIAKSSPWVSDESRRLAQDALEAHRERTLELEAKLHHLNETTGRKSIASLGIFLLLFVVVPQIPRIWVKEPFVLVASVVIGLEALIWIGGLYRYREKVRENRYVHHLFAVLALIMISSALAVFSSALLDLGAEQAMFYAIFGNTFVLATFALLFDRRLLIPSAIYFTLSLVSMADKSSIGAFAAMGRDVALVAASVFLLRRAIKQDKSESEE